jgi:hypothetical protein
MIGKAAILAAPTLQSGSPTRSKPEAITLLGPALNRALQAQRLLGSISLFVCLRAYFLASIAAAAILFASRVLALNTFRVSAATIYICGSILCHVWQSKSAAKIRKKLEFELMVFILGPGHSVILVLFWPGWWALAGLVWMAWSLFG